MNNQSSENLALLKRTADGDKEARDALVINNMGLVYSIVRRFDNRGFEREDLIQIGSIGLIRAAERFNLSFGVQFSTYAVPMIMGEIKRFIRDDGIIKVSRHLKETAIAAAQIKKETENLYGREASVAEIAAKLSVTPEELASAIDSQLPPHSIYATYENSKDSKTIADKLESTDDEISRMLGKVFLEELLINLTDRDKTLIYLRYFKQKTQAETAVYLKISQVQVSRLEKKILIKLRQNANDKE